MKVTIIGIGNIGRQIAFCTLAFLRPDKLVLHDVEETSGDVLDLQHAARGLKLKTKITDKPDFSNSDFFVVSAGYPRGPERKKMEELEDINKAIVKEVIERHILPSFSEGSKVIMVTNPVEKLTDWARENYPQLNIHNPEEILMDFRQGEELGWKIVSTKGYSDFGPAVATVELMKKLKQKN